EAFRLAFGSIAQVVEPTTVAGQKTFGYGWNRLTNSSLDVTNPTAGVTASTSLLDQTPEFEGSKPPLPAGATNGMAFQIGAHPDPNLDGAFAINSYSFGATAGDLTGGVGTGTGKFQADELVIDLGKSPGTLGLFQHLMTPSVLNKATLT